MEPTTAIDAGLELIRSLRSAARSAVSDLMAKVRAGYFGTSTDTELNAAIDDMFDDIVETLDAVSKGGHLGRLSEGYPLLCVGLSGTRKTSTIVRMIQKRPEFAQFSHVHEENNSFLISVKAPSPCTLRLLGIEIATAMGYEPSATIEENAVWALIRKNLRKRGIRVIHIDELQHLIDSKNVNEIKKVQNTLKGLVQTPTHPVWLILSGLPEIARIVEGDTQVWRRVRHVVFRTTAFPADADLVRNMVKHFAGLGGLDASAATVDEAIHRLMHASLQRLGIAIAMLQVAIRVALKAGSKTLLNEHLAEAFRVQSGCNVPSLNPFLTKLDFTDIDVGQFFTDVLDQEEAAKAAARAQKGSK